MFPPRLRTRSSPGASKNSLRRAYGHATPGAPAGRSRHIPVAPANEQLQPSPRQSTTRVSRVTRYEPPQPRRACDTQHHPERAATTAPRLRTRSTTPSEPLQPRRACGHATPPRASRYNHTAPADTQPAPPRASSNTALRFYECAAPAAPPGRIRHIPAAPASEQQHRPPLLRASHPSRAAREDPAHPRRVCERAATPPAALQTTRASRITRDEPPQPRRVCGRPAPAVSPGISRHNRAASADELPQSRCVC